MTATAIAFLIFGSTVLYGGLITTIIISIKSSKK
ncbi:MAG: MetS family NSS transporter small subunit [Clostridiales bacterium]|nr:MetS family NSS transporter small subunit [Clostridiales bacterium]